MMKRTLSLVLSSLMLASSALADAGENSLWKERRARTARPQLASALPVGRAPSPAAAILQQLPRLERTTAAAPAPRKMGGDLPSNVRAVLEKIPASAAHIRDVAIPEGAEGLVVLVQDVHLNGEAQKNISTVLASFGPSKLTVGVEGAAGRSDLSPIWEIKSPDVRKAVADAYLRDNLIAASSHAGIVKGASAIELVGVDHPEHYRANVAAFRRAQLRKADVLRRLDGEESDLRAEKARTLAGAAAAFDAARVEYEKGRLGIGPYLQKLTSFQDRVSGWKSADVDRFVEAYEIEASLDFDRVERERAAVLEKLVRQASESELRELLARSVSYRSGAETYADFYRFFDRSLKAKGIALDNLPAFRTYLSYVLLSDTLNPQRVIEAMERLEAALMDALPQNDAEKSVLRRSKGLYLARKLVDFGLTPAEWTQYAGYRRADLADFEAFYAEADVRSEHMVDRAVELLRAQPSASPVRRVALVAGGFHTPILAARMRTRKLAYAVVQPRITKVEGTGTEYLSIFVREKTPLEKIFEGQKLFLAPAQLNVGQPAGSAVTNEMNAAGRAVEAQGAVVEARADGIIATTAPGEVPGAVQVGQRSIDRFGVVRFLRRAQSLFQRAARAVGLSRRAAGNSLLDRLENDAALRARVASAMGLPDPALLDAPPVEVDGAAATNPALLAALRAARPGYPVGVPLHLDSHQDLITTLAAEGRARSAFGRFVDRLRGRARFTPGVAALARLFVESHDLGYSINYADPNFEAEYKDRLIAVWRAIAEANGDADPQAKAEATYRFVVDMAGQKNMLAYMVPKVLAHGTASVAIAAVRLQQAGFSEREALGLALLFAAHHPGHPITFVEKKVIPGTVPVELLSTLLITDTRESAEGRLERGDPEALRTRIADTAAPLLGISQAEARRIATMGYALDRITPARRMKSLDLSKVEFNEDGTVKSAGQDFWLGGETSKKYPLIVTNIKKYAGVTIANIYDLTLGNLQEEADAAVAAAASAQIGLDQQDTPAIAALADVTRAKSTDEILATGEVQQKALAWAASALGGAFSGRINDIDADIRLVRAVFEALPAESADRDAASYLLGTLIAIRSNGMAMGHAAGLEKEERFEREMGDYEKRLSAEHLEQTRVTEDGEVTVREKMARDMARVGDPALGSFKAIRAQLLQVMEENMRVSLDSLERKNDKFEPMRFTRQRSIQDAMKSLTSDFDSVAWMFPNDLEKQRKAAVLMAVSFQLLLLQDEADLELPYVSHSLQHAHDVRNGVFDVLQVWRSMDGGEEKLQETYGRPSGLVMLMAAWLHDTGYGTLTPALKEADARAKAVGLAKYSAGKGYHTRLGLAIANTPINEQGQTLMDLLDDVFDLSAKPGLAKDSRNGRQDFEIMILSHGADKMSVLEDGLAGTGRHALREASDAVDPLNFAVRLADNLDARIEDRLYSYQKNPIFWGFLMKLAAKNTPADQVKAEFVANRAAYIQATVLHLEATEGVSNGEALSRATADFEITRNNLDAFDYSNYAHFAGMVKNYELRLVDGKLQVLVTLNREDRTLTPEFMRFQMKRMRDAFASLSFLGQPVEVVEADAPSADEDALVDAERRLMAENQAYRDLLLSFAEQSVKDASDPNQAAMLLSLIDFFNRQGSMEVETLDLAPGERILTAGSSDKDVYILVEGEVSIQRNGFDPIVITAGDFLGEMAIANPRGVRNADAFASGEQRVRLLRISGDQMRRFFADPLFLVNYSDFLGKRQPVADEAAEAADTRAALAEAAGQAPVVDLATAADPTAAMSLGAVLAEEGEEETYREPSEIRNRIVANIVNRVDQAESQQVLIQAILAYDRDRPAQNVFSPTNLRRLKAGDELIREGEFGDDIFIVVSGELLVRNGVNFSREAGSIVGEMALTNGGRRTASVIARADGTDVLRISGAVLRGMMAGDQRVYRAYQQLVRARLQNNPYARQNYTGTLTALFTLRAGSFLFGFLRALGAPQAAVDALTRVTVALVIEAPLFAASLFSSRFLAWFVDAHFGPDGAGDTAENRRQIRRGIVAVNAVSLAAAALGAVAAAALGVWGLDAAWTALASGLAGQLLAHLGFNAFEISSARVRRQQAARQAAELEGEILRILAPVAEGQAISTDRIVALINLLAPKANRGLGVGNAANARAYSILASEIRADDGLTRADLAGILPALLLLITSEGEAVDLAETAADAGAGRNPQAAVRLTAARTDDELRAQIRDGRASKSAADVLVLVVDAAVSDEQIAALSAPDVRFLRNTDGLELTAEALGALTGLGAQSRIALSVSRKVALTDALVGKIRDLQRSAPDRVELFLLLDEATRAVPVMIDQLADMVRVQRLIAIQA